MFDEKEHARASVFANEIESDDYEVKIYESSTLRQKSAEQFTDWVRTQKSSGQLKLA